jgi:hypothetical protein
MALSVYIETTITGHLTSRLPSDTEIAGQMLATRRWWRDERRRFELFTSLLVHDEALQGDAGAASERLSVITGIPLVPTTDAAVKLADELLAHAALPATARVDALHLGTATANGLDFLLTWNCRHLANAVLRPKIEEICRRSGFEPPIICTPYDLMEANP